ncbi:hypothetical protein [Devosia sp. MC521]|uniref:hypothetical protein n=1 Tax=Devosia sp. MC521 TaxID=2759954 RepID=UPI0015FDA29F|nr:hypothetical protein [Devosia sp. MC521]MBJ6988964.1 hypothetical protein [Devosia sp. MC521]QMW64396.1 hypothetical protein H4N61_08905 [Devosia sp. MC521]
MSDLQTLKNQLSSVLGHSSQFWPGKKPKLDDYYEAYLWAETIDVARVNLWSVKFINAGPSNDHFTFRMGPGLITNGTYTYALISKGSKAGELHIGVRVMGVSATLHEFDVLGLDQSYRSRPAHAQPDFSDVRFHIEAKFHKSDLSLGIGRGIVGLGQDCPGIEPFLVAKNEASPAVRPLVKHHGGHVVEHVFPGGPGVSPYFRNCVTAALDRW